MSLKLSTTGNGKPFEEAPVGVHPAFCIAVIDLGTQQGKYGPKHEVRLMFEFPHSLTVDGRPHVAMRTYGLSLNEKADLRKDIEAWRGKPFTAEQADDFDLVKLLGQACIVNYSLGRSGEGRYITGLMPIPRVAGGKPGMDMPDKPHNAPKFLELSFDRFDDKVFDSLSDKTRLKIAESPEFKRLFPRGLWAKGQSAPAPQPDNVASTPEPLPGVDDSDIPF